MTDELTTLVREEFAPVRMPDGLADVTARGARLRRRLRAGGALALVATLTLGAGLLLGPATDQPRQAGPMRLAAWSVEPEPDGAVLVTVRQLTDAEGLTATLRRAGVPALVEFKQVPPEARLVGCAPDGQESLPVLYYVMPMNRSDYDKGFYTIRRDLMPAGTTLHLVIFAEDNDQRSVHISLVEGEAVPCRPL